MDAPKPHAHAVRPWLVAAAATLTIGCSSSDNCPPGRYHPSQPAVTELHAYDLSRAGNGTISLAIGQAPAHDLTCDATCRAIALDPTSSCEQTCKGLIDSVVAEVESCTFAEQHTKLDCVVHHPAVEASCSCSIYDC